MKRIKTILAAVLVFALMVAITAPLSVRADNAPVEITIFHTNDIHGRFVSTGANIVGIDAIAAMFAATDNAILVDAGDTIHGLPFVNLNRGLDAVELMSQAGFSLMVPGNHDFNFGWERTAELAALADFDMISANVSRDGTLLFAPTAIREVNGVRLGFVGLSHPNTPVLTNANNVRGLSFTDFVAAAERGVAELQAAGVDIVIALAHLGSGMRGEFRVDGAAFELAEAVTGIDLIIDGHSHTHHPIGYELNDVLIVQAGGNGAFMGRVDITVAGGNIVNMTASTLNRADIVEALDLEQEERPMFGLTANILTNEFGDLLHDIMDEQDEILGEVVAVLPVAFPHDDVRAEETAVGNLAADALRWATGADIALFNGGGLRATLPQGNVTVSDVFALLPFGSLGVTIELTGAQLWAFLNHSVGALSGDVPSGGFMQVSGVNFTFNPMAEFGSRVLGVTVGGREVAPNSTQVFTVALPSFIATEGDTPGVGGDRFPLPIGVRWVEEFDTLDIILVDYLNSPAFVVPTVEGRIMALPMGVVTPIAPPPGVAIHPDTIFTRPAQMPIPVDGVVLVYTVQPGETLWTIAYNFYGSMQGDVVYRIIAANRAALGADHRVQPGMTLTLPAPGLRDPIIRTADGVLYQVQRGDRLSSIALEFYGDSALWRVIYQANAGRLRNANTITVGQWLVIPVL